MRGVTASRGMRETLADFLDRRPNFLWLLTTAVFLAVVCCKAWLCDDAFISFRTADNFVHGYGLNWNVQERVQTYTHPLWLLLFSAVYLVTREPHYTAIFLSLTVSAATVVVFARKIARSPASAALGILLLTVSTAFTDYSTSGLENPLTHLLAVVFLWLYWSFPKSADVEAFPGGRHVETVANAPTAAARRQRYVAMETAPFLLSLVASLAAVNRMDTILLYLPALAYLLWKRRTWRCLWSMAVGSLPLLLWLGFSTFYYGFPFPNTAYAKLNNGINSAALAAQGCYYLWNSLKFDPITLATIVAALAWVCWRRQSQQVCVAIGMFLYMLYIVKIGGDFMSGRFLTMPLLVAVCLLSSLRLNSAIAWAPTTAAIALLWLLSCRSTVPNNVKLAMAWSESLSQIAAEHGICNERAFYSPITGLFPARLDSAVLPIAVHWIVIGNEIRLTTAALGERFVTALGGVGLFGYHAGASSHIVDQFALADPLLARLPSVADPCWRIGHFQHAIPFGYLATLWSGKNVLREPDLAEYYDHLSLIIQGPLWDRRRLAAIWNMNLGKYDRLLEPARKENAQRPPLLQLMSDPSKAVEDLTQAIGIHPKDPSVYHARATAFVKQENWDKAIEDFTRVIELQPDNAFAYNSRGLANEQQGNSDAAITDFGRAVELKPYYVDAYNNRGELYNKLGRREEAVHDFTRAAEAEPSLTVAFLNRGHISMSLRDRQLALDDFQHVITVDPIDPIGYHLKAATIVAAGNLNAIYKLPEGGPVDLPVAIGNLAWVLATHPDARYRNADEALCYAKLALALQPRTPRAVDVLAAASAEAGHFSEAIAAAEQAVHLATAAGDQPVAQEINDRLRHYEAHEPYHVSPPMP